MKAMVWSFSEPEWPEVTKTVAGLLDMFGSLYAEEFIKLAAHRRVSNAGQFDRLVKTASRKALEAGDGLQNKGMVQCGRMPLAFVPDKLRGCLGNLYWKPQWVYESHSGETALLVGHGQVEIHVILVMTEYSSFGLGNAALASIKFPDHYVGEISL